MNLKKIIKEEMDDFQWMRDVKPHFWKILDYYTQDDPKINVIMRGDKFVAIEDDDLREYWGLIRFDEFIKDNGYEGLLDPHDIDTTKRIILHFLEVTIDELKGWTGDDDLNDFYHLYGTIEDIFNK